MDSQENGPNGSPGQEAWPECPRCGTPRTARCPVCKTEGTDFASADPNFLGLPEDTAEAASTGCGCGGGGCSPAETPATETATPDASEPHAREGETVESPRAPEPAGLVLVCSTCDDPFTPRHSNRCNACGHEFTDGYVRTMHVREPMSPQVVAVLVGLAALGLAIFVYFASLV